MECAWELRARLGKWTELDFTVWESAFPHTLTARLKCINLGKN